MKIAREWVGEATVRFNKVQRLFKLHLTWSNLTNSEHASNGFKLKRVSSLTVFLHIVLEAFELSWNLFIDAASHISQSRQRVCVCVLQTRICNETIYFLTRCNWRISIKSTSMSRNVNELTENCLRQNKSRANTFFSLFISLGEIQSLQFSCNSRACLLGIKIDMLVTINEPIIVIQLKIYELRWKSLWCPAICILSNAL